jgi:hypothetical protein
MSSNRSVSVLTGKAKAGYFFLGLFLAVVGVLISWLMNKGRPTVAEAVKLSALGFIVAFVLSFTVVLIVFIFPIIADSFV